jgi:hypothetical protein
VSPAERERIEALGRRRGQALLATGLLARKAHALKALGWPDAVRDAREHQRAS